MEDGASRPCHSSSGQDIRQPILSPRTDSSSNSTPPSKTSFSNISSMTSSEISPASNNSEGTPNPSEDLQSETDDAGEIKLHGNRTRCAPLLRAAIIGDWPAAKAFLDKNPDYVRAPITREKSTALHIAATAVTSTAQHTTFVEELLLKMTSEDLALETTYGFTTLHSAAQSGNVSIAKQLLKINGKLQFIHNCDKEIPLHVAAYLGQKSMVLHLLSDVSFGKLTPLERRNLLHYTICTDMYDIALRILKMDPTLATVDNGDGPYGWTALKVLAKKPFAIGSNSRSSFLKSHLNSWFKGAHKKDLTTTRDNHHQLVDDLWTMVQIPEKQFSYLDRYDVTLIFEAAKVGNVEFLIELTHSYPDLLWQVNRAQMSIFHIAVSYRHESVFNLIYEIGGNMHSLAGYANSETKDNMLHLAGRLAPLHRLNIVSGAALQLQREWLWFKEIEKTVPWSCVNKLNSEDKTPMEVFIDEHSDLRKEGEKWMRNTANYSMVVATLIAAVMFAVAFAVPSDSNQEKRTPMFQKSNWFMIFFVSDAIALCSSTTSIIFFLSILTSRYTVEDFFKKLPSKLMLGFATLFFSVVGMMVAFSATCFSVHTRVRAWASFVVIISAGIPIISFLGLHLKLFVDIFRSTYNSRFLFRPNEYRLFQRKMQGKQKEKKIDRGSTDLEQGKPRKDN